MSYIARSSNGRTPVFGTGYLGSNPSLAANEIEVASIACDLYFICCLACGFRQVYAGQNFSERSEYEILASSKSVWQY